MKKLAQLKQQWSLRRRSTENASERSVADTRASSSHGDAESRASRAREARSKPQKVDSLRAGLALYQDGHNPFQGEPIRQHGLPTLDPTQELPSHLSMQSTLDSEREIYDTCSSGSERSSWQTSLRYDHDVCMRCRTFRFELNATLRVDRSSLDATCQICAQFFPIFDLIASTQGPHEIDFRFRTMKSHFDTIEETYDFSIDVLDVYSGKCMFEFLPAQIHNQDEVAHMVHTERADMAFVQQCLRACRTDHGQLCEPSTARPDVLRLIDCHTRRVEIAKPDQRYLCLSYVWGSGTVEGFALKEILPTDIPKTVEDAMFVAASLSIPYLWVDRYCIDQGNPHEKHDTIRRMDRIYNGAELTIVATAGDGPSFGLAGVRGTMRKEQLVLQLYGRTYIYTSSVKQEITACVWNQRGWTYQEMLLSQRRLVFTTSQMYFQCTVDHKLESFTRPINDHSNEQFKRMRTFPRLGTGLEIQDLEFRLNEYYQRQLSYKSDTLHAFAGVLSAFDDSTEFPYRLKQFYGVFLLYTHQNLDMARTYFLRGLLWSLDPVHTSVPPYPKPRSHILPSWSWASARADDLPGRLIQGLQLQSSPAARLLENQVSILLTSKASEHMDITAFIQHDDGYEDFLPQIDISSWVLEASDTPNPRNADLHSAHNLFLCHWDTPLTLNTGSTDTDRPVLAVYIGLYEFTHSSWKDLTARGLLLCETEPGLFSRLGTWELSVPQVRDRYGALCGLEELLDQGVKRVVGYGRSEDWALEWRRRSLRVV